MSRPRVVLADDNGLVAAEIHALLAPEFDVIAVVNSGEELEAAYDRLAPQVIITDIAMPGEGGLVAAKRIRERDPEARVVLLTVINASSMIRLGLSMGAYGYVLKEDAGDELVPAVLAALEGRQYVSSAARPNLPVI